MIPSYTEVRSVYTGRFAARAEDDGDMSCGRVRQMMLSESRCPWFVSLRSALAGGLSHIMQLWHSVLPAKARPTMCANYGHVVARGNWGRGLPKCQECGITIKDPSELRKANPLSWDGLRVPPSKR